MQRPTRIAAVTVTTGVLMAFAAVGVFSIQQAVAGATTTAVVTAEAPALLAPAGVAPVVNPADVLGDISDAPALPPIPNVKVPAKHSQVAAPRSTSSRSRTANSRPSQTRTPRTQPSTPATNTSSHEDAQSSQESGEQQGEAAQQAQGQEAQGDEHEDD